jgi:transcription-repair coupling factor (superfamily II helicase)
MMDLSEILPEIRRLPEYRRLIAELDEDAVRDFNLHLPRSVRPAFAAAIATGDGCTILYLVPREDRVLTLSEELRSWNPGLRVLAFPQPNPLFYERAPWGPRTIRGRIGTLSTLTRDLQPGAPPDLNPTPATLVLASARAAMTRTISPRQIVRLSRWLRKGGVQRLDKILELLVASGYSHASVVSEPGQFSRRGGILDLWPPSEVLPVRIEFFGDEMESLRRFDPATQRSAEEIPHLRLSPAREGLPALYREEWDRWLPEGEDFGGDPRTRFSEFFLPVMNPEPYCLIDFLPPSTILLVDDLTGFDEMVSDLEGQAVEMRADQVEAGRVPEDFPLPYVTLAGLHEDLRDHITLDLGVMASPIVDEAAPQLDRRFSPGPRFGGQVQPLMEHISEARAMHDPVVLVSRQASRLSELWAEDRGAEPQSAVPADLEPGDIVFLPGALSEGWTLELASGGRLHLLTDGEIFGWSRPKPRPRTKVKSMAPEAEYADLRPGSFVVHIDYGVGRFIGLVERKLDEMLREYLLVEYAEGDQLYVPIHQADRITPYVGVDKGAPALSRLGSPSWERAKAQAQRAVDEVARDLLDLYAQRMTVQGFAFPPDTEWQRELEASFPYAETADQLKAIEDVKRDMEHPRPMDRLLCGDVGYGKTEIALRAAFKAVMGGKQVAILVPTTVLAQQHFHTFQQRLAPFPVSVEMLSRFRTRQEAEEITRRLVEGAIDIVIGTHRLLQPSVSFKRLGLLIIDEEQRFGVTHKEFFKQMRTQVDVLTMTATPIPRTLYMALTGARDISTINTPPEERLPVMTHVGRYNPRLVRQAILRELDRGGQVFFVHNRVQTIDAVQNRLERLVPEAQITIAHGQMPERELARVMDQFAAGEIDVLVSTSIIESGLDFPNANTLIVDRADTFGLAQLYQLRGRVGRGAARAYAYFFRHSHFKPTEDGLRRMEIIAEHSQLGAGYSIAMRDLEMRGAGDILGTRQHGHIGAIGFHLYTRLLSHAVHRLKAERESLSQVEGPADMPEILPVSIELPLAIAIPTDYVPDRDLRLQLYRRVAEIRDLGSIDSLGEELADRFGPIPPEVRNMLYMLRVKLLASQAGVESVGSANGQIRLQIPGQDPDMHLDLGPDVRQSRRGLWLQREPGRDWQERLLEVLTSLSA